MPKLSTKPNRFYPSIPTVSDDTQTHKNALDQVKESLETHERRNSNYLKSFVRFEELVDLGIIDSDGEFVLELSATGGVEEAPTDGSKYGRQNSGWSAIDENATHTGEVTGDVALTVQVASITNRTAPGIVEVTDEIAFHDSTDGNLKRATVDFITDAGYF